MRIERWIIFLGIICFSTAVFAYGERKIEVEGTHVLSCIEGSVVEIVVLAGVSQLIRSGEPDALKVEHTPGRVFVTPLVCDAADLVVIDRHGKSFRMKFHKSLVQGGAVIAEDERVVLGRKAEESSASRMETADMVMLRALASGQIPSGVLKEEASGVLFEDENIRLTVRQAYITSALRGYVVFVENLLNQSLVLPVQRLFIPGLLLSAAERDILGVRGSVHGTTMMYMVLKR